jgi:F0F1-type ATP synthase epsilon subunit
MQGLSDKSELKEKVVMVSKDKAVKYRVVEEEIDIARIRKDIEEAKKRLAEIKQLTDQELLEWAREHSPYMNYNAEIENLNKIIEDGEAILKEV